MPRTLRDLNELTAVANGDWVHVNDISDVTDQDKKISRINLIGTTISGGGAINTGGFTLTVAASGTAALKTGAPTLNQVAAWHDGNTVKDGGFAVGDIGRLSTAQSYSALKTFNGGLSFGQTTLNWYQAGTWTPVLTFGGTANGLTYAASGQTGRYIRIGTLVSLWATIRLSNKGSSVGSAAIAGMPFASANVNLHRPTLTVWPANMAFTGVLGGICVNNTTDINLQLNNNGVQVSCTDTTFANNTVIYLNMMYETA